MPLFNRHGYFPELDRVIRHEKLKLAIEIYASYRFEVGDNAQFITLITALEALLPAIKVPDHSKAILQSAKAVVKKARNRYSKDSKEWDDLNHLLSRVGDERESIGRTIDAFISEVILRHPQLQNAARSIDFKALYDVRSKLLHRGQWKGVEVKQHSALLREFMPRLLKALFREAAGAAPEGQSSATTAGAH